MKKLEKDIKRKIKACLINAPFHGFSGNIIKKTLEEALAEIEELERENNKRRIKDEKG